MASRQFGPKTADPAEGARENVNVPNAADEAHLDRRPTNGGSSSSPAETPGERDAASDTAFTPPREDSRDRDREINPHKPRRRTI